MSKSRLLLSDLLDQLSFALCIVRKDYLIVKANEYFQSRVIFPGEIMQGKNILELFPEAATYLKRKIDTALILESSSFSSWEQKPHLLPFKSSRPVSGEEDKMYQDLEVIPIHSDDGGVEHVCVCVFDATIQASQQQQLRLISDQLETEHKKQRELIKKLEQAQGQVIQSEKMASIGQLSAGIAHEINNPASLLLLNLPVLKETFDDLDEILEDYYDSHGDFYLAGLNYSRIRTEIPLMLQDMLDGTQHIRRIVNDLRDFARQEPLDLSEEVDLNIVATTAVRLTENTIRSSTRNFVVNLHSDLPKIKGSSQRLQQVVINLIVNACQALESMEQGIAITTSYDTVTRMICLSVKDEGKGIEPDNLGRLSDPFFTTKREQGGTGLGLSISSAIIEEHDGRLNFESAPGIGTKVTLYLPQIDHNHSPLAAEE